MSNLTGTVSAGAVILNDWAITMEEIDGGHRLTARRGSEEQSMPIMDGLQGEPGEKGEKGDTGATGPQGERGPAGKDAVVDPTLTQSGAAADAAAVGDKVAQLSEEMAKKDKPHVYIDGEIPTTKNNVLATMTVKSKWLNFFAYIKIKCQGSSSMNYPKKNFTVTLWQDEERTIPLLITIPGWKHSSNKFVLKADYIDHTHARNILGARLWSEIVAARPDYNTLPMEMRNSPNNGAINGFPIIVYANGTYQGLYTWNIGKDAWMWGMNESDPNHVLLSCCYNDGSELLEVPGNFRALWDGVDKNGWEVEVGTNSEAVKNSLNALISCVKDTDDVTFKETIGKYLDVQSAIDYYAYFWANAGLDSLENNLLLATYDGVKWICGAYDMDSTWGLHHWGTSFISSQFVCPDEYQGPYSLLWERIVSLFWEELKARYTELRHDVLSYANIVNHFERFCGEIGKDAYDDETVTYPGIPSAATNNIWQIRNFVRDRLAYVDEQFYPREFTTDAQIWISANNFDNSKVGSDGTGSFVDNQGATIDYSGFAGTENSGNDGNGCIVMGADDTLGEKLIWNNPGGLNPLKNGVSVVYRGSLLDVAQSQRYIFNTFGLEFAVLYGFVANTAELYGGGLRNNSQIVIDDTNEHTIVYTYDYAKACGYLDGEKVFEREVSNPAYKWSGRYEICCTINEGQQLRNKMRHFLVYERALTEEEVVDITNNLPN